MTGWRAPQLMRESVRSHSGMRAMRVASGVAALLLLNVACAYERSGVGATVTFAAPLDRSMLTITFREGSRSWQVHGADLRPSGDELTPSGGIVYQAEWVTGTSGSIDVSFDLADSSSTAHVTGQVTLPLQRDWRWRVTFLNATDDPTRSCFGCAGRRPFALPAALRAVARDSLWVVWSGNSTTQQVVY